MYAAWLGLFRRYIYSTQLCTSYTARSYAQAIQHAAMCKLYSTQLCASYMHTVDKAAIGNG